MSGRATVAIAWAALGANVGPSAVIAGVLAALAALAPPRATLLLAAAGIIVAALGAVSAARIAGIRNIRLLSAPLYGRELARALALAPNAALVGTALLAMAAASALLALTGHAEPSGAWFRFAAFVVAGVQTVLVALPGALRDGGERVLYIVLATLAGTAVAAAGAPASAVALIGATLAATVISVAALRGFGETLARFDPLD